MCLSKVRSGQIRALWGWWHLRGDARLRLRWLPRRYCWHGISAAIPIREVRGQMRCETHPDLPAVFCCGF